MPWFDYYRTERLVSCFYFDVWHERCGPGFIKVCSYAPYPIKIWVNGHEIVKRMAAGAGIAVTPLANGFATTTDPARLQQLCDPLERCSLVPAAQACPLPQSRTADRQGYGRPGLYTVSQARQPAS